MNSIHAARRRTRTFLHNNRVIRADLRTFPALNTFILIDHRASVRALQRYCPLGANLHTGMRQTPAAAVCHKYPLLVTGVAGKFDNVNQRRRIVGFRLIRCCNVIRQRCMLCRAAVRQPHSEAQALAHDRALQEHVVSEIPDFSRNNLIRQLFNSFFH